MYNEFALIYDQLMEDVDYKEWYSYIINIFNRFNRKPETILEMACGTGNLSYYFAENGYDLTCFDLSDDMLSIAYNKLSTFKNVKLFKQNMIDFNIHSKFDLIISICDSINYILNKDELLNTFNNVKEHLNEDGIFIFDINSDYKLKNVIGNNVFVEDTEDVFYAWENNFDEESNISEFFLTFFVKNDDGTYRRFDEEHMEKAYSIKEIVELLKLADFREIYYFAAFTFNKPKENSERINFVVLP